MDVRTFNEIYDEVATIQKYFVMVFDKNIFTIWTSLSASKKYHALVLAVEDFRELGAALKDYDEEYVLGDDKSEMVVKTLKVICSSVVDFDISGYVHAHQILEDRILSRFRLDALCAAYKIADIIGFAEDEMINGLD